MPEVFVITGLVREKESKRGLPNLIVHAYAKDVLHDDLMGEGCTSRNGNFRVTSEAKKFQDFFTTRHDIYLRVMIPDRHGAPLREIFTTTHAIEWNARHCAYVVAEIPHLIAHDLLNQEDGQGHNGEVHAYGQPCSHSETCCDHEHHKPRSRTPVDQGRDIYLKIEKLPAADSITPYDVGHTTYPCDREPNTDHNNTQIPETEMEQPLETLVYREYLDPNYMTPQNVPYITADHNEPRSERHIPRTVIYTSPGERLFVHVCNDDDAPHSFRVLGLFDGIDSDSSWSLGLHDTNNYRSDAICPGQTWCYVFDLTEDMIGTWPFHDHHIHSSESVNHGLFGAIVVRDHHYPKPTFRNEQ